MATQLEKYTPSRRLYPWDEWTNGKPWLAERGADFDCTPKSFWGALRVYGCRFGYSVRATIKTVTRKGKAVDAVEFTMTKRRKKRTR